MEDTFQTFIFDHYHFDEASKTLSLHYALDEDIHFTETFVFDFDFAPDYSREAADKACFGLWVMAGISYFKAFLPPSIQFKTEGLTSNQKEFFEKIYLHGLGEFFYVNDIDPNDRIHFPSTEGEPSQPISLPNLKGGIVALGGGKDSLTTVEILQNAEEDFETWTLGEHPHLQPQIQKIGTPYFRVLRTLDPQLIQLNQKGALNGHIPISAILGFVGVIGTLLRGKKNIIFSNEHSANEANTTFHGLTVNHQYSKSLEFEQDFQRYVRDYISPDLEYFSFLRPLTEMKIAEIFCSHCFKKYQEMFSSCNRNFRLIDPAKKLSWCGHCPKCAFVALLFAPFVSRAELNRMFGTNVLTHPDIQQFIRELVGLENIKPLECVGQVDECRAAAEQVNKSEYPELAGLSFPPSNFDPEQLHPHAMPVKFENILKDFLSQ